MGISDALQDRRQSMGLAIESQYRCQAHRSLKCKYKCERSCFDAIVFPDLKTRGIFCLLMSLTLQVTRLARVSVRFDRHPAMREIRDCVIFMIGLV